MKATILTIILATFSTFGISQSNRILNNYNGSVYQSSNKDLLMYGLEQKQRLYDSRVNEIINMLNNLIDIYKLKTEKFNGSVPLNISQYYQKVSNWLVDATKHDLANDYIWIQVQDYYIQNKSYMMSW